MEESEKHVPVETGKGEINLQFNIYNLRLTILLDKCPGRKKSQ